MTKYEEGKEKARAAAIDWQYKASETMQSWQEIAQAVAHFEKLGKRYGLREEFRENGII